MTYHNLISTTAPAFGNKFAINGAPITAPNSSDLYDAIVYSKSIYTPNPSITPAWNSNFYGYFNIGTDEYYTLIRIPEFSNQGNYPFSPSIPIIIVAENVIGATFYNGYTWDATNNNVQVIQNMTDDIVEDHIDNQTAYIIVVGYDALNEGVAGGRQESSCEGGYNCMDDYCDKHCGEPESCLDCQPQNRKKLYLYQIRIDEDIRYTKGGTLYVIDNHFVDNLGGHCKLSLNSVVLHANGKWTAINDEDLRPKWKQSEVVRTKIKNNGSTRGNGGTSTWKTPWLKGDAAEEAAGKGILLAENFNPTKAKIYISIAEKDALFGLKRDIYPPTYGGTGIGNNQDWKSQGMPTLCGPAKNSFFHDNTSNPSIFQISDCMNEILPTQWIDINGNPVSEITISGTNVSFKLKYE